VAAGDVGTRRAPAMILGSMKMDHVVRSPATGLLLTLDAAPGTMVAEGADVGQCSKRVRLEVGSVCRQYLVLNTRSPRDRGSEAGGPEL
jgi:hypothetical protein